jgi:hypothetical protein
MLWKKKSISALVAEAVERSETLFGVGIGHRPPRVLSGLDLILIRHRPHDRRRHFCAHRPCGGRIYRTSGNALLCSGRDCMRVCGQGGRIQLKSLFTICHEHPEALEGPPERRPRDPRSGIGLLRRVISRAATASDAPLQGSLHRFAMEAPLAASPNARRRLTGAQQDRGQALSGVLHT